MLIFEWALWVFVTVFFGSIALGLAAFLLVWLEEKIRGY